MKRGLARSPLPKASHSWLFLKVAAGAKKKLESELKTGIKPARKAAADAAVAPTADEPVVPVIDEATAKELETMRKGVEKALEEARGILKILDSDRKSS